jgi:hypothetical protein
MCHSQEAKDTDSYDSKKYFQLQIERRNFHGLPNPFCASSGCGQKQMQKQPQVLRLPFNALRVAQNDSIVLI